MNNWKETSSFGLEKNDHFKNLISSIDGLLYGLVNENS
jgi:hypothetical protein